MPSILQLKRNVLFLFAHMGNQSICSKILHQKKVNSKTEKKTFFSLNTLEESNIFLQVNSKVCASAPYTAPIFQGVSRVRIIGGNQFKKLKSTLFSPPHSTAVLLNFVEEFRESKRTLFVCLTFLNIKTIFSLDPGKTLDSSVCFSTKIDLFTVRQRSFDLVLTHFIQQLTI